MTVCSGRRTMSVKVCSDRAPPPGYTCPRPGRHPGTSGSPKEDDLGFTKIPTHVENILELLSDESEASNGKC